MRVLVPNKYWQVKQGRNGKEGFRSAFLKGDGQKCLGQRWWLGTLQIFDFRRAPGDLGNVILMERSGAKETTQYLSIYTDKTITALSTLNVVAVEELPDIGVKGLIVILDVSFVMIQKVEVQSSISDDNALRNKVAKWQDQVTTSRRPT